jgi:hypothetical protein
MECPKMRFNRMIVSFAALAALGLATACSEDTAKKAGNAVPTGAADVEKDGKELGGNVQNAAETLEETYDEERKKGQGRVEARG